MRRVMAEQNGLKALLQAFMRYLLAGGLAWIVNYVVRMLLFEVFGVHYLIATAIGFCLGLFVAYICCNKFVFSHRKMEESPKTEFSIFAIIGGVGLLLTLLFMWLFNDVLGCLWSELGITQFCNYVYSMVVGSPMKTETCVFLLAGLLSDALELLWSFGARKIILY